MAGGFYDDYDMAERWVSICGLWILKSELEGRCADGPFDVLDGFYSCPKVSV